MNDSLLSPSSSSFLLKLRNQYQHYLFDDFLPYIEAHIIDEKYGGFMCNTNRRGENITNSKRTWYDGRGIWVFSFLYNYFGQNKKYLDVARRTVDLVLKVKHKGNGGFWPEVYTREGTPLSKEPGDIYGGLFVAEGLVAYARSSGESAFLEEAKSILFDAVKQYDNAEYQYLPHYDPSGLGIKAPRVLGHWMVLLNVSRQILEQDKDQRVKGVCDRCIMALLDYHLQPGFDLMIEYLSHDFSLPGKKYTDFSYIGHAIEALWMIMAEAERRGDQDLFLRAARLFRRHVEVAWDDVYGGFFHCLNHTAQNEWVLDKVLWVQEEVMVGLIFLIVKEEDQWAKHWAPKVWDYLNRTFVLQDHPSRLWINGGDRQLNQQHQIDRFENYHHPRHLMLNLLQLKKII